NLMRQLMG
ncbi:bacterial DNA polymerase III alpha subunit, partial [Chlamydia psittaci 84-8471/1]